MASLYFAFRVYTALNTVLFSLPAIHRPGHVPHPNHNSHTPNRHVALAKAQESAPSPSNPSTEPPSAVVSTPKVVPMTIPYLNIKISLDEFCPPPAFAAVMVDFFDEIYPIMPLVHRPTYEGALKNRLYDADPEFLQLCVAMAAFTVTTFPQRLPSYGWGGPELTVAHIVELASVIVRLNRGIDKRRTMVEYPTVAAVVSRMGLSYSCHHSGEFNNGWSLANEAVLMFRELGLYRAEAYAGLTRAGAIISRRMFWVLYMMQMCVALCFITSSHLLTYTNRYSYTSAPEPLTVLHFDATKTDWDALYTNDMDYVGVEPDGDDKDDDVDEAADVDRSKPPEPGTYSRRHRHKHTLIMAGFNAIIAMHVCVTEMLVDRLPRPPPFASSSYARSTSTSLPSFSALSTFSTPSPLPDQHFVASPQYPGPAHHPRLPSISLSVRSPAATIIATAAAPSPSSSVTPTLQMIETGMARIRHVLDRLPPELRFPHPLDMPNDDVEIPSHPDPYRSMRANTHLTGIFLQSLVIESYVAKMLHTRHAPRTWTASGLAEDSPGTSEVNSDAYEAHLRWNDRSEIWKLREGIAKELQNLLRSFPMSVFEVTGVAMTVKIRRVAATLLEHSDPTAPPEEAGEAERRRTGYLDYFVRVLTELDHSPTASFGFVKSRS